MSEEQLGTWGQPQVAPMDVVEGYQVFHSNPNEQESSVNGEGDAESDQADGSMHSIQVKFEPVDTEYEVTQGTTTDSHAPSTSLLPPRLHSQNVADIVHGGTPSMQTQIREILGNKSLDSTKAAANVQNAIEALLKKNEVLLAQNDALGLKPNPRRGRLPGELGKHSQVVFPQVPGQFATFSAGGNTQAKIRMSGGRNSTQNETASNVPMGRIVRPKSPTGRCSVQEKDKSHFSLALMECKVGDEESEEIFQVQEHEMVCAVASKTKFLNIHDQVVASFDISYYWCNFCTFSTPNKALLLQHVMDHRFHCKYCRYQSFSRSDVIQHSVHTHPDFQEVAAITKYCTLLSDYLRVKNPNVARLDSRRRQKRRHSCDDDSDQDGGQPPKLSRQFTPVRGKNAKDAPVLDSADYNFYDVSVQDVEESVDGDRDGTSESQSKGTGSASSSASSSSTLVAGSDSLHTVQASQLRSRLATQSPAPGQPVITQVFSAASFPHAPRVSSPLPQESASSTSNRRSGTGSNSSSRSGSARASPSPSSTAGPSGGERSSPQIRSNLYWSCGYCSFTSKGQSEIKDHSVRQHSGKPHRYVALIKPGGDSSGSNAATPSSNEKDADGDATADGNEQEGSSDTPGDLSPAPVTIKQEPEDSDEEIVPIKVRFPPARIQSKDTSSLKCYHCKYSSRLLGPLRNHILYNHKGSCLIGLGPMNAKVFMCPRADCTFRSSSGLTFLNHSKDCTPWSKPEARDVRVEPHLLTCLEETIRMAQDAQGVSQQQPKVSTENDFSCTYCSFSSPSVEEAKRHVLNRHGNRTLVVRNVRALRQRKRSFIFFCRSCLWESAKMDDNHVHQQCCTQASADPPSTSHPDGNLLNNNNVETSEGDKVFLDVSLHDEIEDTVIGESSLNVRDPLDDHNYQRDESLRRASNTPNKKVAHRLPSKNVARLNASVCKSIQARKTRVNPKKSKLKQKQPFLGFNKRKFKNTLPTGSTGIFDENRLGEVQCTHCCSKFSSLEKLKEHYSTNHSGILIVSFRSLRRQRQHLKCIFYACPSSKCSHFRWIELDVVNHYRQTHSLEPHPYLEGSYSPCPKKEDRRISLKSFSQNDDTPQKNQLPKKVRPVKTSVTDETCYQCLYCPGYYYADTIQEMKDHYLNAHPDQDIVMRDVDAHKDKKTSRVYVCTQPSCDFSTLQPQELKVHADSEHAQKEHLLRTYQCTSCGWITNDNSNIAQHISSVHEHEGGAAVVEIGQDERGSTVVERGSEERRISAEQLDNTEFSVDESVWETLL